MTEPPSSDPPSSVPPDTSWNAITAYCRATELLRRADAETRNLRAEQREAQKSLASLLEDSMQRHGVQCVPVSSDHGSEYICLVQPPRRPCSLKTVEDVMALLHGGVAEPLQRVPTPDLPKAVSNLLVERARAKGPPQPPARVKILAKPPGSGANKAAHKHSAVDALSSSHVATETRTLSEQFSQAVQEAKETRLQLKPLRAEVKRTEAAAAPCVAKDQPVAVQMRRASPSESGSAPSSQILHVAHKAPKPATFRASEEAASANPGAAPLGIRVVSRLAQAATTAVLLQDDSRTNLDDALERELRKQLTRHVTSQDAANKQGERAAKPRLKILRRKPLKGS